MTTSQVVEKIDCGMLSPKGRPHFFKSQEKPAFAEFLSRSRDDSRRLETGTERKLPNRSGGKSVESVHCMCHPAAPAADGYECGGGDERPSSWDDTNAVLWRKRHKQSN